MKTATFMALTLLAISGASASAQESMNPAARGYQYRTAPVYTGRSAATSPDNGAVPVYRSSNPTGATGVNPYTGVPVGRPLQHNDLGTPAQSELH